MYLLNIPYKSKPGAKLPIFGIAKYIRNENGKIIQEWAELIEGSKFKGKEKYGKKFNEEVINFRTSIVGNNINDFLLGTNELKKINNIFKSG